MNTMIEQLSARFQQDKTLAFFYLGDSQLPAMRVTTPLATCTISLYGAQILSYQSNNSNYSLIWENPESFFVLGKPIRGGVPICWPWFGAHPTDETMPNHGFARLKIWNIKEIQHIDNEVTITFNLPRSNEDLVMFPYEYELNFSVRIGAHLTMSLATTNLDTVPFQYSAALHSYFNVQNIHHVSIKGLSNCEYIDETLENAIFTQNEDLRINSEIDRLYMNVSPMLILLDEINNHAIRITQTGSSSTQIWNPWEIKSKKMKDFKDSDYEKMICIEAANSQDDSVLLNPGNTHHLAQEIKLI